MVNHLKSFGLVVACGVFSHSPAMSNDFYSDSHLTSAIGKGRAVLEEGFIEHLLLQQEGVIETADKDLFITADSLHHVILISDAMGLVELHQLFKQLEYRDDVSFAIRGLLPNEKTINDVGMRILRLLDGFQTLPHVVLDPRPFAEVNAENAPMILTYHEDTLLATATGLANPVYMENKVLRGEVGDLGSHGAVVTISERDLTEVMNERMANLDMETIKKEAVDRYWDNATFYQLPSATQTQERIFTPLITLHEDITLDDGTVLFAQGQQFNTLEQLPFTQRLVIFDATNEDQMAFVKSLPPSTFRTTYVTTRFDRTLKWDAVKAVEKELNAPVMQLNEDLITGFDLMVIPSVITADNTNKHFVIQEVAVGGSDE
ncbi:incF plasmid conjugative transfer pilus assembly protein traW [Vibrio sp. JCM 19236]|nr:incF plasmid conjugative transfer pilus assembly protein traW [Vibrio sp. JCM 19236]